MLTLPGKSFFMTQKFLNIPFRSKSSCSDFSCKDGEIESFSGVTLSCASGSSVSPDDPFMKDPGYLPEFSAELPPPPQIQYTLIRSTLPGWHIISDSYPSKTVTNSSPSLKSWGEKAREVLNEFMEDSEITGRFVKPFLALAAWRLNDGSTVAPSVPVLLIPNSEPPLVAAPSAVADTEEMDIRVVAAVCKLCYRIKLPESLREFASKISSLDLFVSHPLKLYDPTKNFTAYSRITSSCFCHSLDQLTGEATERIVSQETFPLAWKPSGQGEEITSLEKFFLISSIPFHKLKEDDDFLETDFNTGSGHIFGNDSFTPSYCQKALKSAGGAYPFKGRVLLWSPRMEYPKFAGLRECVPYTTTDLNPRWIFNSDPDAEEYQFDSITGIRKKLALKRHPSLSGSYYFSGFHSAAEAEETDARAAGSVVRNRPGFLWLSEKTDPPLFKDSMLHDAECGRIIAVCRAFRSSALAATVYPTIYIFSETGVYLYKQDKTGLFTDAGLIASYILKDAESLKILPRGIRFLTADGETVTIEGSTVRSVSSGALTAAGKEVILTGNNEKAFITTRPVKADGGGEFKFFFKAFLRGNFDPVKIKMAVFGSRDMNHWHEISRRRNGSVATWLSGCHRFIRFEIEAELTESESLHGLTIVFGVPGR